MAVPRRQQAEAFQTEIYRLNHESVAAFNRGDVSTCASFYTEDATMLLPDQPLIKGRASIQDFLEGLSVLGVKLTPVEPSELLWSGDLACCAGTCEFRVSSEQGNSAARAGKFVTVFRREQDGSWKAVVDSFFTDTEANAVTESHRGSANRESRHDGK